MCISLVAFIEKFAEYLCGGCYTLYLPAYQSIHIHVYNAQDVYM